MHPAHERCPSQADTVCLGKRLYRLSVAVCAALANSGSVSFPCSVPPVGGWFACYEFVDVGVAGLLLSPARREQRIDELADELADPPASCRCSFCLWFGRRRRRGGFASGPAGSLPAVGRAEDFRAVLGERDVDGGGSRRRRRRGRRDARPPEPIVAFWSRRWASFSRRVRVASWVKRASSRPASVRARSGTARIIARSLCRVSMRVWRPASASDGRGARVTGWGRSRSRASWIGQRCSYGHTILRPSVPASPTSRPQGRRRSPPG